MNFNQLRYVREVVRHQFNLTAAASSLFASQPGVSKAIIELENELGVALFQRHGKRLKALTESGLRMLPVIERLLTEAENLKRIGLDFSDAGIGNLTLATTHTQARYTLPPVVESFTKSFPNVRLSLLQGSPPQLANMVLTGAADIAVATESIANAEGLVALPFLRWEHAVVIKEDHPLWASFRDHPERLSLQDLAAFPLVTYEAAFAGRARIDQAFARQGLDPVVVLAAIDADVIKTYVEAGLGVGIVAGIAFDARRDVNLRGIKAGHLFGTNTTHLAFKKGQHLRSFVFEFIRLLVPHVQREDLDRLAGRIAPSGPFEE